uniref:Uncharacterized protein n=1 Tax=Trichogramma kaykai TaxID=54128 RepID=A0ABD2VVD4_9HYME
MLHDRKRCKQTRIYKRTRAESIVPLLCRFSTYTFTIPSSWSTAAILSVYIQDRSWVDKKSKSHALHSLNRGENHYYVETALCAQIAFILFSTNLKAKKVRKGGSRLGESTAPPIMRHVRVCEQTRPKDTDVRKVRHSGASSAAACGIGVESRVLLNTSKKYFSSLPSPTSGGLLHTLLLYRAEI